MPDNPSSAVLRPHDTKHWTTRELAIVAGVFLLFYLPFLSIDYDSNGVIEAADVETGRRFSPNHILYTLLGRGLFLIAQAVGYEGRAIYLLQTFNAFCGAIGVAVACVAFVRLGAPRRAA